ncbi:hypothetical protein NQ318_021551 [Aromia moschata]|uniref:Uncharacterized protein n=1 Tax=Aromia moschata TaxID=1265417 RepID=A0AAV8YH73_9CUCU|nr:hypothetical protein NQ318_021551 [Aromia moschata]
MNSVDFLLTNKDITYDIQTEIKRVYDRFKWLCGCPKRNKLFCFICLVMGGNRSAWTQEGCYKFINRKVVAENEEGLSVSLNFPQAMSVKDIHQI